MTLQEASDALKTRVTGTPPIGGVIKFDLASAGALLIDGRGSENTVTTDAGTPADCTIGMSLDDLTELFHGRLQPTVAFMQGKMKVDGDMGLAMKLSSLV